MVWKIEFSRKALKDAKKIKSANLDSNLKQLLQILKENPALLILAMIFSLDRKWGIANRQW